MVAISQKLTGRLEHDQAGRTVIVLPDNLVPANFSANVEVVILSSTSEETTARGQLSPAELGELARQMVAAPTDLEAKALETKILAGFYGEEIA